MAARLSVAGTHPSVIMNRLLMFVVGSLMASCAPPKLVGSPRVRQAVLVHVLEKSLRLLHPFMPFLTEEIRGYLKTCAPSDLSLNESII